MMRAVKAVTTYRGRDPRDFVICAFGGNGPLVAVELARALQIATVVIPPSPGVFSALGLLFGDGERELVRTLLLRPAELRPETVEDALASLKRDGLAQLADDGHSADDVELACFADLRYAGQAYELPVRLPAGPIALDRMLDDFVTEHERTYGHGSRLDPVELVSVRVVARIPRANAASYDPLPEIASRSRDIGERHAYFGPDHGTLATPVVTRAALLDGERAGPLLVDEYDSTIVVPPGCIARLDGFGNVEVTVQ
jgi:N-methylhydantoinase A